MDRNMKRITLEILVEEADLQEAIDEMDPQVPCSTHEEQIWLEEVIDQLIKHGKFSIQVAEVEGQSVRIDKDARTFEEESEP